METGQPPQRLVDYNSLPNLIASETSTMTLTQFKKAISSFVVLVTHLASRRAYEAIENAGIKSFRYSEK